MEWKEVKLGDYVKILSGYAYKGKYLEDDGENVLLGMGCVSFKDKFLYKGARGYSEDAPDRFYVEPGDLVLATRQQSDNLPILGMPAKIPNDIKAKKIIFGANLYKIENKSDISNDFLFWQLKSNDYVDYIRSVQTGTTVRMITKGNVENYTFKCPDKESRDKIVSILSSLDSKIETNNKINAKLEEMAQALFKSWFVDFEPFKDKEMVESELGMIPEGWRVVSLDEICSFISRGLSPKYDTNTNELVLGQTCVRNNIVTLTNARNHLPKSKSSKKVELWDTLINSTGIGSLGRVGGIYFDKDNVSFDSHLTVVRAKDKLHSIYICRNLLNRQLEIENMAIGSTGQTELPRESVKNMKIILPPDAVIKKFSSFIKPISLKMYSHFEESSRLSLLRDTLLPKLMSGEIELD